MYNECYQKQIDQGNAFQDAPWTQELHNQKGGQGLPQKETLCA